jgi:hypothetical protein
MIFSHAREPILPSHRVLSAGTCLTSLMKSILTVALLLSSFAIRNSSFAAPPNILFIVADDMGYAD